MFNRKIASIPILALLLLIFVQASASADRVDLSFVSRIADNPDSFSLVIDRADRLAGIKVTLAYDTNRLVFEGAEKSKATASFLHVVNHDSPGQVIIVMASARGVSGNKLPLIHLTFHKTDPDNPDTCSVKTTHLQLLTENLQEISVNHTEYVF